MSSRSRSAERTTDDTVAVGRVLRAHGIRGELKIDVWSDVEDRFAVGGELLIKADGIGAHRRRIASCRADRGHLLLRFEGVEDRDAAESLRDAVLEVEKAKVPEAPEGLYYFFQLIGCQVEDRTDGVLGTVVEVIEDGGGHVLQVEGERGVVLVPFVDAFLRQVDVDGRRIDVELPPGLIESCTSKR